MYEGLGDHNSYPERASRLTLGPTGQRKRPASEKRFTRGTSAALLRQPTRGRVVAIDVDTGSYALGKNAIVASESLRDQRPDAQVWLMRVGHRALYHFGGSSLRRAE